MVADDGLTDVTKNMTNVMIAAGFSAAKSTDPTR
jgi:hypothetical protein